MKKSLIILLAFLSITASAQIEYGSEWKKARNTKWTKTAISVGASLASIALEMTGDAIDLSGDTLTFTIKKNKGGAAVATLSTASEITISGASNNVVNIAFNLAVFSQRG